METEEKKRKTKTSSAVKNRYNKKMYSAVTAMLQKELVSKFKEKCERDGISQTQIVREAIERYLKDE